MPETLVTGATGLVGQAIIEALLDRGRSVRAVVRSREKAASLLNGRCELVLGDVTDRASLERAIEGCSVVFHAAGLPEQWLPSADIFEQVNVDGTRNMVDVAREADVDRFVYTSTIDVFQAEVGERFDESTIDPSPKGTPYERSKQKADRIVVEALEHGLDAVFLHPSAVYGLGIPASPGLNDLFMKLRDNQLPMLLPGGMPVVFDRDVGEGHVLAQERAEPGARYILSESFQSLVDIARAVRRETGRSRVPPIMPRGVAQVVSWVGERVSSVIGTPPLIPSGQLHFLGWGARPDASRAKAELGWNPVPFEKGLEQTLAAL